MNRSGGLHRALRDVVDPELVVTGSAGALGPGKPCTEGAEQCPPPALAPLLPSFEPGASAALRALRGVALPGDA